MKLRTLTMRKFAALAAVLTAASTMHDQITLDGIRDAGEVYTEASVQETQTNWGQGNFLGNLHYVQNGNFLHLHLGARANGNAIILFIDAKSGGQSFIPNNLITSGGEENTINNLGNSPSSGMTFENDFTPEMAIRIFGSGGDAFVNRYNFATGTRTYSGQANDVTVSDGPISGIRASWQDVAVIPDTAPAAYDHANANQGVEIALNLFALGVPIGEQTVKVMAILVNGDSSFGSNQVLATRFDNNDMGGGVNSINFELESGIQFIEIPVIASGLDPNEDEDDDGYLNGAEENGSALGYISDPLIPNYTNMNVAGSFNGFSTNEGVMLQGDTSSLITQYHWTHERHLTTPATSIEFKFTTGDSFDINWGQGSGTGAVARNGGNISGFVGAAGIYRIFFDQGALTHSFQRRSFGSYDEFRAAYGLAGDDLALDADANPGDGWTDYENYQAGTHPLVNDTDGDGTIDSVDAQPLTQLRNITFSVNMNVQIANGNFDPDGGFDVKLLVFTGNSQNFDDPYGIGGYTMEDPEQDGIYTFTLTAAPGFETQPFGQYKFFNTTPGAPNSGYEEGFDRDFALGEPEVAQILATVFFSNDEGTPTGGFAAWAAINAGGGAFDEDFDGDGIKNGIEFFFGETGSSFTANPAPVNGVISWPRDPDTTGVTFKVWTSETLAADSWLDVTFDADLSDPNFVKYTLPTAPAKLFVRLEVLEEVVAAAQ